MRQSIQQYLDNNILCIEAGSINSYMMSAKSISHSSTEQNNDIPKGTCVKFVRWTDRETIAVFQFVDKVGEPTVIQGRYRYGQIDLARTRGKQSGNYYEVQGNQINRREQLEDYLNSEKAAWWKNPIAVLDDKDPLKLETEARVGDLIVISKDDKVLSLRPIVPDMDYGALYMEFATLAKAKGFSGFRATLLDGTTTTPKTTTRVVFETVMVPTEVIRYFQ